MYQGRRARVSIVYEGKDITIYLAGHIKSFDFTDNSDGVIDDFTLTLHDKEDLWKGDWSPAKGDKVQAKIEVQGGSDHENNVTGVLDCGEFWVDAVKYSSPPSVVKLSGRALDDTSSIRCVKESTSWENTTLEQVLSDVTGKHGYDFLYEAAEITYNRIEQNKQSGLAFLKKLTEDAGMYIKLTGKQVVIYDDEFVKSSDSIFKLRRNNMTGYDFDTDNESYSSCIVKFKDPETNKTIQGKYNDPDIASCKTLTVERKVADIGEAIDVARRELKKANRREYNGSCKLPGNVVAAAGSVFELDDFGNFAGKYMIDVVKHSVSGIYTAALEVHRVSPAVANV